MKLFLCLFALISSILPAFADEEIVNGYPAFPSQLPWQVSLQLYGNHFCGGSIISKKHILTAAHCFPQAEASPLAYVVAGSTSQSHGERFEIKRVTIHPQFNQGRFLDNDIAVVALESELKFSNTVQPVKLANAGDGLPTNGTPAVVSGWGFVQGGGPAPVYLEWVDVEVINRSECNTAWGDSLTTKMLCAVNAKTGGGACNGDSGGPLVDWNTKKQIGIVSFGNIGCEGKNKRPDVYSSVAALRDFITQVAGV